MIKWVVRCACVALCILHSQNSLAGLTGIGPVVQLANGSDAADIDRVTIDSNPATGETIACWVRADSHIACQLRDLNNNLISSLRLDDGVPGVAIDGEVLDVALDDDGSFYLLWSGDYSNGEPFAPLRSPAVQAFDRQGAPLFAPVIDPIEIDQATLALTPQGYWLGISQRFTSTVVSTGETTTDYRAIVRFFSRTGVSQGDRVFHFQVLESPIPNVGLNTCHSVSVASSRSGDLVVSWVEPNIAAFPACFGTVFAQTFRPNGTPLSDVTQLSSTDQNDMGDDISAYGQPSAVAYENGEYVIAWRRPESFFLSNPEVFVSNISLNGNVATPQAQAMTGSRLRIGGNSANQDYVVLAEHIPNPLSDECHINGRLALDAKLLPDVRFNATDCGSDYDVAFNSNGQMLLLIAETGLISPPHVSILTILRPAEIEISNVSVLEGNPAMGQGNRAAVQVSINRAHPAGEDIEVSYFTRDGTALAGIDYQPVQGSIHFPGILGQGSQVIEIPVLPDLDFEDDELLKLVLENPVNAVLRGNENEGLVTIVNDDTTPPVTVFCDNGAATNCREIEEPLAGVSLFVPINLSMAGPVDSVITVNYTTVDGSATAGSDYVATSGSIEFQPGALDAQIIVTILGDQINEDTETFDLVLSAGNAVDLPTTTYTFSILNEALCFVRLNPAAVVSTAAGGPESFSVETLENCQWQVSTNDDWLSITSPVNGVGPGEVMIDVAPFDPPPGVFTRSGEVVVTLNDAIVTGSASFLVDQDGDCDFTVDAPSFNFAVSGGVGSFDVSASDPSCDWFVSSPVDWLTINAPTAPVMGNGTVTFTLDDNAGPINVENMARNIMLASEQFDAEISQDGCVFDLDTSVFSAPAPGTDQLFVNVLAPTADASPCQWTAVSNTSWILIENGASGSGGGMVQLDVLDNPSVMPRSGSVNIGDELVTINQDGVACDYQTTPAVIKLCPDGGDFQVNVAATEGCSWQMQPQDPWLQLLTNASGLGSEITTGMALGNLSESPRSGTLLLQNGQAVLDQVELQQAGFLVYEPFNGNLPGDWLFTPSSAWSSANGVLTANLLGGGIGTALDQTAPCKNCKVETAVRLLSASDINEAVVSLIGWYEDNENFIALSMNEFSNRWSLVQVTNGDFLSVSKLVDKIIPAQSYHLTIRYDGERFYGDINGVNLLQMPRHAGTDPIGYAGLMVVNNNAQFEELRLTGTSTTLEVLLQDSFEETQTGNNLQCTF
ncbi:MAG: hypothetical protein Tsb002_34320 [Wenzhouxiangellaceae bacterium]